MDSAFFGNSLENLPVGAVVVDRCRAVLYANRYVRRYTADAVSFYPCLRRKERDIPCGQAPWCLGCSLGAHLEALLHEGTPFNHLCIDRSVGEVSEETTVYLLVSGAVMAAGDDPCALLSMTDITALKQKEQSLQRELELEPQTKTLNKSCLHSWISRLQKSGQAFILCMIDFDWFKRINDRCGHLMGDMVLNDFARISRRYMGKKDLIGRYGGDEFVILFQDLPREEVIRRVSQIHEDMQEEYAAVLPGFELSYSVGMVTVDGSVGGGFLDLLKEADRLMYAGKNRGKSRLVTADGEYLFESRKTG